MGKKYSLIAQNFAGWTLVCSQRNLVHPAPGLNDSFDLRYSAECRGGVSVGEVGAIAPMVFEESPIVT